MSWRTNRAVLMLRTFGRAVGLNRRVAALVGRGYERRFRTTMFASIGSGCCVWDVGANVGLYSTQFARIAGPNGRVFAFEPSPSNLNRLRAAVASLKNVTVVPIALGERDGVAALEQGTDSLGATSAVVAATDGGMGTAIRVRLASGDRLIASGEIAVPHVIKIDTEGSELDVLHGLEQTLLHRDLRLLCIEVHFGLLDARGLKNAPSEIERLLTVAGFSLEWPDASHVVATRVK